MRQGPLNMPRSRLSFKRSVTPLGSELIVILALLLSVLFILSASLVFVNPEARPSFRDSLNNLSKQQSGIVVLGENVDVDVDEPSVTIRWSVLGCGTGYILPGSPNLHDSTACGVPAIPVKVYLDSSDTPIFSYEPDSLPVSRKTSQYLINQAQLQFDNDFVLDVHDARLYPFDKYLVSTTLRVTGSNSSAKDIPLPIIGIPVLKYTTSFTTFSRETDVSYIVDENQMYGRHVEIEIRRPVHSRIYGMLILGINWVLCHFSFGIVVLSIHQSTQSVLKDSAKRVMGTIAILFLIPQLRNAMPDAPGLDGVLIDTIGYFPQMTLTGLSVIIHLLIATKRELDSDNVRASRTGFFRSKVGCNNHDVIEGHYRSVSMRDYMLEQMSRILEDGIRDRENNESEGGFNTRNSTGTGTGRSHLR